MQNQQKKKTFWKRMFGSELSSLEKAFAIVYMLLILTWPIVAFATAFLFDDPNLSAMQEFYRETIAWIVYTYPLYYIPLLIFAYRTARNMESDGLFYQLPFVPHVLVILCLLGAF